MSKYVDEVIKKIQSEPTMFRQRGTGSIEGKNIKIFGHGNSAACSIIHLVINGHDMPMAGHWDKWRLEKAVSSWFKTVPFDHLIK